MGRRRGNSSEHSDVGYGRPPKHTQFKPGQSGNPKGRQKGQPTFAEVFVREASRHVRVQQGDRIGTISKLEAIMRKLLNKAMEGDLGAARLVIGMASAHDRGSAKGTESENAVVGLGVELPDEDTLRRMIARFDHLRVPNSEQQK